MNRLAEILSSRVRAEVFRLLFGISAVPLHLREIERQSGLTMGTVQQEMRKLVRLDLVTKRKDGNRVYFAANREHPLFTEIHGMVLKTAGLVDVLRKALKDANIGFAFVFGSIATQDEKALSDIDLMVLGSIGLRKLTGLLSGVAERIGREINPHAMTVEEFKTRLTQKEHFVSRLWQTPRIFVVGTENEFKSMVEKIDWLKKKHPELMPK